MSKENLPDVPEVVPPKEILPTPPKEEKEDVVKVSKKTLDLILSRLETNDDVLKKVLEEGKEKDKKIEMLVSIADKGRLARYEDQNRGALVSSAKVSFWESFPILAWTKGKDEVGFRDGRLIVNQTIKLFLDKGEKEPAIQEVDYLFWAQNVQSESGEVIEKVTRGSGNYWTIQMKDGRKITLDIRFINAF